MMTLAQARKALEPPLRFGNASQIEARKFIEKAIAVADLAQDQGVSLVCETCGGSGFHECECSNRHECEDCEGKGIEQSSLTVAAKVLWDETTEMTDEVLWAAAAIQIEQRGKR